MLLYMMGQNTCVTKDSQIKNLPLLRGKKRTIKEAKFTQLLHIVSTKFIHVLGSWNFISVHVLKHVGSWPIGTYKQERSLPFDLKFSYCFWVGYSSKYKIVWFDIFQFDPLVLHLVVLDWYLLIWSIACSRIPSMVSF